MSPLGVDSLRMTDGMPLRGSLRSRSAAALSMAILRQISAVLPPERAWGLWLSRQILARIMDTFGPSLAGSHVEQVDAVQQDGRRVVGEWVCGAGVTRHRFPTAADDVRAGWQWLVRDRSPEAVVIAGDSAGGHLAVDLLLQPDMVASQPCALVLFSPLIDLTFALAAATERERRDPAIRAADAARLLGLYSHGVDPTHPRLALNVTAGPPLPRTLIQAGGAEILSGDARRLAADIRAAGGSCELQVWPDQAHVFQALPRLSPEAARAMAYAAHFIADSLSAANVKEAS